MIVVVNSIGQTCNRLLLFANALATAMQTRQTLVFVFGRDVRKTHLLPAGKRDGVRILCFPLSGVELSRIVLTGLYKSFGFDPFSRPRRERYAKSLPRRISAMERRHSVHAVFSFDFKNHEALRRFRQPIVDAMPFRPEHLVRPRALIERLKKDGSGIVCGVHVRRGDYRKWRGGRYFYDDAKYASFMRSFLLAEPGTTAFVVCSNEPVDLDGLRKLAGADVSVVSLPDATMYEDLALLSLCDYVMGPPSTYSWWAAFHGGKPRLALLPETDDCSPRRFCRLP